MNDQGEFDIQVDLISRFKILIHDEIPVCNQSERYGFDTFFIFWTIFMYEREGNGRQEKVHYAVSLSTADYLSKK